MMHDITCREDIELIIRNFYADVRNDTELGFLFDTIAQVNWQTHIPIIVDFWEQQVLGTAIYTRNAMTPHFALHALSPVTEKHFAAWLVYFNTAIDKLFSGDNAQLMKDRAKQIAAVMQHKLLSSDSKSLM